MSFRMDKIGSTTHLYRSKTNFRYHFSLAHSSSAAFSRS